VSALSDDEQTAPSLIITGLGADPTEEEAIKKYDATCVAPHPAQSAIPASSAAGLRQSKNLRAAETALFIDFNKPRLHGFLSGLRREGRVLSKPTEDDLARARALLRKLSSWKSPARGGQATVAFRSFRAAGAPVRAGNRAILWRLERIFSLEQMLL
jgi:hypothetical protein